MTEPFTKICGVIPTPHRLHSPDLAPSHFDLSATVKKERPKQSGMTNDEELFDDLHTILRVIPGDEPENAFEA
jgi:hypothetical protein